MKKILFIFLSTLIVECKAYWTPPDIIYSKTCLGDTSRFSLRDSIWVDSVVWDFGDTLSGTLNTSTSLNPKHYYATAGRYLVTAKVKHNLWGEMLYGRVLEIDTALNNFLPADTSICPGDTITLSSTAPFHFDDWLWSTNYLWSDSSTWNKLVVTQPGNYWLEVSNGCGISKDTIDIRSNQPKLEVVIDSSCGGGLVKMKASGADNIIWPGVFSVMGNKMATIEPLTKTTYTLTGDNRGCSNEKSFSVSTPTVKVVRHSTHRIEWSEQAILKASDGAQHTWVLPNDLNCKSCNQIMVSPEEDTDYLVNILDMAGCKFKEVFHVKVEDELFVPNAFTPNNDGVNDRFAVSLKAAESFTLTVYDRWGLKVFESYDPSFGWDGTQNGKDCEQGTFVYHLSFQTRDFSQVIDKTGKVTLIR